MKVSLAVIGLLLFLMGCGRPLGKSEDGRQKTEGSMDSTLVVVDSLMWSRPDSAFVLLQERFSPDDPYAQLLLAELLYKNYYGQSNRGDLLRAVGYFDTVGDAFLDARAHYINGVGYYENDSVAEACQEYLKALEIMEDHFKEKELVGHKAQFMGFTLTRLTDLFSDQFLAEQVIYFAKQSLGYYEIINVPSWYKAWTLNVIGGGFDMIGQLDSADFYYTLAIGSVNDSGSLMYRDIKSHQAFLTYQRKGMNDSIMHVLNGLLNKAENGREYYARCLTIGQIYLEEHSLDSAWKYLNEVYENTNRINAKKQAAEWLIDIYKALGREDEIHEYASYLVPFANQDENHGVLKSQLSELYKHYIQRKSEREQRQNRQKSLAWGALILASVLVLSLFLFVLNHKNKKARGDLELKMEEERFAHEIQRKALSSKLNKRDDALKKALSQLRERTNDYESTSSPGPIDYTSFVDSPICCQILDKVQKHVIKSNIKHVQYEKLALSKKEVLELRKAADDHMGRFTHRLKECYADLTYDDITLCCLYLLGLNDAEISALIQKSYSTMYERRKRISRVINQKGDLSTILRNL